MSLLFDFECARGHRFEEFVELKERSMPCPICGFIATRLISAPNIKLEGISGDFPTAADKWEKRRESHMKKERKNKENHGTYE